jgi:hypothetical protein
MWWMTRGGCQRSVLRQHHRASVTAPRSEKGVSPSHVAEWARKRTSGLGALVTRDVPEGAALAGHPATWTSQATVTKTSPPRRPASTHLSCELGSAQSGRARPPSQPEHATDRRAVIAGRQAP